jgi:DNA-directed RNA polymerase specialized sigma24 family protein
MDPDPQHTSDEQILVGLRGDGQPRLTALRLAMEKYALRVGGLARKYVGASDPHDTVEIVDKTFQALWENEHTIDISLWSWLARVAINQSITLVRKRSRRRSKIPVSLQDETASGLSLEESGDLMLIAGGLESPWSGIIFEEYIAQFAYCIESLPPIQKAIGAVMLKAARQNGELPDNAYILKELRLVTRDQSFSLESVKSAKKQVLTKIRNRIVSCEKQERRTSAL